MAPIFKLASLDLAGGQRQSGMRPFDGLHAGQFIRTHNPFTPSRTFGGLTVQATDVVDLRIELVIRRGR
jgi:hypothetical protein